MNSTDTDPCKKKSRSRRNRNKSTQNTSTKSISVANQGHKKRRSRRKRNKNKKALQNNTTLQHVIPEQCEQNNTILTGENNKIEHSESKMSDTTLQQTTIETLLLPAPKIYELANNYIVMAETPTIYELVTSSFISKWKDHEFQRWIHKLSMNQKQNEKHLKLYMDNDFIAVIQKSWVDSNKHCDPEIYPNPKQWGKHPETDPTHLRIMAIVNTNKWSNLITLRDIRGDKHCKLLCHIKTTLCKLIEEIYGLKMDELKIYVHYRPTALLFHIHFVHVNNYKNHRQSCRDHFLDDIIRNIEKKPNYYRDVTLKHKIYFDRAKSIPFAKHMKGKMDMKCTHRWFDKPDNKRPINRSMPLTMKNDENKTNGKITKPFVVNKSKPDIMHMGNDNISIQTSSTGIFGRTNNLQRPQRIQNRFQRPTNNKRKNGNSKWDTIR